MRPIPGFLKTGKENCVLKLRKALYGTKQAAHAWQKFLRKILVDIGGKANMKDECVFMYREKDAWVYVCTHVDDIFVLYNQTGENIRDKIYDAICKHVVVENRGEIMWALSTKLERDAERGILKISQKADIEAMTRELGLEEAKEEYIPAMVGAEANMEEADY